MQNRIKKIVLSAFFISLGLLLPLLTGQLKELGSRFLPMHLPVFLAGLILGSTYGSIIGFILPIFRSILFSRPILFPTAISMSFELLTYGFVCGLIYEKSKWKCIIKLYESLIIAMISGRIVAYVVNYILFRFTGNIYTINMFYVSFIIDSIPGIIIQLTVIPILMVSLNKTNLIEFIDNKKIVEI